MKFKSDVTKKIGWTIFLMFIYVLGSKLTLPFVDVTKTLTLSGFSGGLELTSAVMGGGLKSMNIFSIGLSPWMSSMLLWRMFTVSKKFNLDNIPFKVLERRKMYLALVVAIIQSLSTSLYLPLQEGVNSMLAIILNTVILIAGAFFLIWLADINSMMGLGSSTAIMIIGMILYMPSDIDRSFTTLSLGYEWLLVIFAYALFVLYVAIIFERSIYQVPISKIGIHNDFKKYSYLDIKLNPAGGMPIMYALSLVSIPQYILMLIVAFKPNLVKINDWISSFQMGKPVWLITYVIVIFILGIGFAFVNVNGDEISDKMQKNAEYIEGIYPGNPTRKYINSIVRKLGVVGALYLVVFSVAPMLIVLKDIRYLRLSMIPGIFMIFIGMVFMIKEEVKALRLNEKYTQIF